MRILLLLVVLVGCPVSTTSQAPPTTSAALGCGDGQDGSSIDARLGEVQVSQHDVDVAIGRITVRARERYGSVKSQRRLALRVAEERLLCRAAQAAGFDASDQASRAAEEAIAAHYVDVTEGGAVTDASVRAYYEEHADRFKLEVIDAKHIVVETEEEAHTLLRELRAGASFANLAMGHSLDRRSKDAGGVLGWMGKGRMDPAWSKVAFALEEGETSDPVRTSYGWTLIHVAGRKDTQPLEEVRPGIERKVRQNAADALLKQVLGTAEPEYLGALSDTERKSPRPSPGAPDPTP